MTKEHLFAAWTHAYHPLSLRLVADRVTTIMKPTGLVIDGEIEMREETVTSSRAGDPRSEKGKFLCRQCNNNRFGDLQDASKPLLIPLFRGDWSRPTSPQELRTIAAWCCMTAMVLDHHVPMTSVVTAGERLELHRTLTPPANWMIWLGQIDVRLPRVWGGENHLVDGLTEGFIDDTNSFVTGVKDLCSWQSTAWRVDKLFIQTFSITPGVCAIEPRVERIAAKHGLNQVWPPASVPFVRPRILTHIEADDIGSDLMRWRPPRRQWDTRQAEAAQLARKKKYTGATE